MTDAFNILVVDDSPVDRALAGGLARKRGFVVHFAVDGEEGIEKVRAGGIDVVVTDLHMPKRNGFELTRMIKDELPHVPVILMTAHGSEAIAMQALRIGAASFVPKRELAAQLCETLELVLALSREAKDRISSVDPLRTELRFDLDNDASKLTEVVGQLEAQLKHLMFGDETFVLQIGVALREALVNAIFHGNLEVSSDLLEGGGSRFHDLAEQRRGEEPYKSRRVRLTAKHDHDEVVYVIEDEGRGFDPSTLPDPTDPANLERVHGRGLMLMRMFMDEVSHNARGNVVTMRKRRPEAS